MSQRVLNVGLIGGGGGAFIAGPHQRAIHMSGTRRVIAGALHQDPEVAMSEAANWPYPIVGYRRYDALIAAQDDVHSSGPPGGRLDFITIVTPNHVHFDPALKAIRAGIPVFCEKPLTTTLDDATALVEAVRERNIPFGVAHTYLGHWTSRLARHIVRNGLLGEVRSFDAWYQQGWLAGRTEDQGVMQAEWRVDPERAGASCCGGDIGTHALMQLRYITGLEVLGLQAHLKTFVPGRKLDDHFTTYVKLSNKAEGLVRASQVAIGHKNDLGLEVNCEGGTLVWRQEEAEKLVIHLPGQSDRVCWRGDVKPNDGFLGELPDALVKTYVPSGHPEGFHDAYCRLYDGFEADVRAWRAGQPWSCDGSKYANVEDGRMGIAFIQAAVESSQGDGAWVDMPELPK